jgi:hypothetical protein
VVYCPFTIRPALIGVALNVEFLHPTFIYGYGSFKRGQPAELPNDVAKYYVNARKAKEIKAPPPENKEKNKKKDGDVYKPYSPAPPKASKTYVPAPRDVTPIPTQDNEPETQDSRPSMGKISKPEAEPNLPGENVYRDSGKPANN